jgi:hypothetical protein
MNAQGSHRSCQTGLQVEKYRVGLTMPQQWPLQQQLYRKISISLSLENYKKFDETLPEENPLGKGVKKFGLVSLGRAFLLSTILPER